MQVITAKSDDLTAGENVPAEWEIEAILAWHDENPRAAISTLLSDIRHLRHQLALAEAAMSTGMTRGWRPSYDRD